VGSGSVISNLSSNVTGGEESNEEEEINRGVQEAVEEVQTNINNAQLVTTGNKQVDIGTLTPEQIDILRSYVLTPSPTPPPVFKNTFPTLNPVEIRNMSPTQSKIILDALAQLRAKKTKQLALQNAPTNNQGQLALQNAPSNTLSASQNTNLDKFSSLVSTEALLKNKIDGLLKDTNAPIDINELNAMKQQIGQLVVSPNFRDKNKGVLSDMVKEINGLIAKVNTHNENIAKKLTIKTFNPPENANTKPISFVNKRGAFAASGKKLASNPQTSGQEMLAKGGARKTRNRRRNNRRQSRRS
jgi:hypothetical protein